jgi:hypothetical protein
MRSGRILQKIDRFLLRKVSQYPKEVAFHFGSKKRKSLLFDVT